MTSTNRTEREAPSLVNGVPEGMLEHETRNNIRDLARIYGEDEMRAIVAGYVNDAMSRRHRS